MHHIQNELLVPTEMDRRRAAGGPRRRPGRWRHHAGTALVAVGERVTRAGHRLERPAPARPVAPRAS